MAPSSLRGCVWVPAGGVCVLRARESLDPPSMCYGSKKTPFLGRLLRCSWGGEANGPTATSANHRHGLTLLFPAPLPLPGGPRGGWWLRLNEDFLMSVPGIPVFPGLEPLGGFHVTWWLLASSLDRGDEAGFAGAAPARLLETQEGEGGRRGSVAVGLPLSALLGSPCGGETPYNAPWAGPSNRRCLQSLPQPSYQCTAPLTARCSQLEVDPNQEQGPRQPYSHPKEQARGHGTGRWGIAQGCSSVDDLGWWSRSASPGPVAPPSHTLAVRLLSVALHYRHETWGESWQTTLFPIASVGFALGLEKAYNGNWESP